MPKAGFEPEIMAFERSKTVHASDRSTIATGTVSINTSIIIFHAKACVCMLVCKHTESKTHQLRQLITSLLRMLLFIRFKFIQMKQRRWLSKEGERIKSHVLETVKTSSKT
jgi:hypothetical protein